MEALCGTSSVGLWPVEAIDSTYANNVIAVINYGDETNGLGQPWNVGNCTVGTGLYPRLNPSSCNPFAASIHSYCDYGDYQCCGILPWTDNAAHHTYVDKYDDDVVAFIQQRLLATL